MVSITGHYILSKISHNGSHGIMKCIFNGTVCLFQGSQFPDLSTRLRIGRCNSVHNQSKLYHRIIWYMIRSGHTMPLIYFLNQGLSFEINAYVCIYTEIEIAITITNAIILRNANLK